VTRLRETLGRWRHVVRLQTAHVSAVKALLRAAGLGHLRPSLGTEVGWTTVVVGQPIDPRDLPAPQRAG